MAIGLTASRVSKNWQPALLKDPPSWRSAASVVEQDTITITAFSLNIGIVPCFSIGLRLLDIPGVPPEHENCSLVTERSRKGALGRQNTLSLHGA